MTDRVIRLKDGLIQGTSNNNQVTLPDT